MSLETGPLSNATASNLSDEPTDCRQSDIALAVAERLAVASSSGDPSVDVAGKTTRRGRAQGDFYIFQETAYGSFMMVGDLGAAGEYPEAGMQLLPSAIAQATSEHHEPDPLELLAAVASVIYRDVCEEDLAATLIVTTWDASSQTLVVSNAGHSPLLHASSSGVRQLESADAAIGTSSRLTGTPQAISLSPGDFLLMGTDGLIGQKDTAGMDFGFPRLAQTLLDSRGLAASDVVSDVLDTVQAHGRGVRQLDDRTALVITRPV